MKHVKYYLSLLALIILIGVPVAIVCKFSISGDSINLQYIMQHSKELFVVIFVWFLLLYASMQLYEKAKYDKNANAFGMTTKLDYWHMSDKERKAFDLKRKMEMERVMPESAIRKASHKGSKNPDKDIQTLIGMEAPKTKVKQIAARAKYDKKKGKTNQFGSHYVFYGAPGTGKTTFARILTGYLYKNGVIKKNLCLEVDGNTLKASSPGDGQLKAEILVKNALGGVLFIDEAYSMASGAGTETVDSLIKLMEDLRGQFVLILAGYTNEMKMLLDSNPGFRSRIKDYVEFPNYSEDEACQIFISMAKKEDLTVTEHALKKFKILYVKEKNKPDFGNARTVRNILDESISIHAVRLDEREKGCKKNTIDENDIPDVF